MVIALIIRHDGSMLRKRGFLALVCVIALVAAALLAPASGGSTPSVLVPLAPLFGFIVLLAVRVGDATPSWSYLASAPLPSRAPPATL
jgi:hypothetical protein